MAYTTACNIAQAVISQLILKNSEFIYSCTVYIQTVQNHQFIMYKCRRKLAQLRLHWLVRIVL